MHACLLMCDPACRYISYLQRCMFRNVICNLCLAMQDKVLDLLEDKTNALRFIVLSFLITNIHVRNFHKQLHESIYNKRFTD